MNKEKRMTEMFQIAQQVLFGAHLLVLGGIENLINKFIKS